LSVARWLFRADILHCHDWQAGLVPVYLRTTLSTDPTFLGTKTLFTIHNLGYRGLFPPSALVDAAIDTNIYRPEGLEFFGQVSYIKGGIVFADALSTVSPTYAREIQTPELGWGLDGVLRARAPVLHGILNGVDYAEWSPETDPYIPARYSAEDLRGKSVCKQELLAEFGLPSHAVEGPLIGIVSRFAWQKGTDLVAQAAGEIVDLGMYLAALGSGDPEYEDWFRRLATQYPDRFAVRIGFDNPTAHRIEAGADLFLMPSRYEPAGLNQMYSLKYGTVPVVRATGGLNDTIEESTGFKFSEYSGDALVAALRAAAFAFSDKAAWESMMRCGMQQDFSWDRSAAAYSALYRQLTA
jgi:starch synthase